MIGLARVVFVIDAACVDAINIWLTAALERIVLGVVVELGVKWW